MRLTKDQLHLCMPGATASNIERFSDPLNDAMEKFSINNFERVTAFLAQIAHESGSLTYKREIYSGEAYDVGDKAIALGNTPEDDGDGERLRGRGLIQITGATNYRAVGQYFGQDFIAQPELLEGPVWASMSAAWFWHNKQLNAYADMPPGWVKVWKTKTYTKFEWITLLINGGQNGITDRLKHYARARAVLPKPLS